MCLKKKKNNHLRHWELRLIFGRWQEESVATGFAELYDKRYFVSGGTSVYSLDNGQWKLSKNLKTPIYDLLVRNDTLFALTI